ncbi:uncharacterized protein AAES06_013205 [Glossophaga mutica]
MGDTDTRGWVWFSEPRRAWICGEPRAGRQDQGNEGLNPRSPRPAPAAASLFVSTQGCDKDRLQSWAQLGGDQLVASGGLGSSGKPPSPGMRDDAPRTREPPPELIAVAASRGPPGASGVSGERPATPLFHWPGATAGVCDQTERNRDEKLKA